jgi:hypothetical protein
MGGSGCRDCACQKAVKRKAFKPKEWNSDVIPRQIPAPPSCDKKRARATFRLATFRLATLRPDALLPSGIDDIVHGLEV